jgi:predicted metal-dependent phosphoesterase TrpH
LARAYEQDPKAAADRLKKHRAIAGMAGNLAERRFAEMQQQRAREDEEAALVKAREELRKMAQEKPLEFADRFLTQQEAEEARARIQNVERGAAKKMMEQIGAAYHGLPEWVDLSDDEKGKLREAIANVPEDETLPRFNRAALDIVADRRAARLLSDRLPQEREAWKKEWEAERLAAERGPDLRRPSSTTHKRVNWSAMDDKDFNAYWKERYGR